MLLAPKWCKRELASFVGWKCSSSPPQIFLLPTSLPESSIPHKSHAAIAWASGIQGFWQIEFEYLSLRVGINMAMYNSTNFSIDIASPSLYIGQSSQLYQEEIATQSLGSPAYGLGREMIIITIIHNKIFALRPAPILSEPVRLRAMWWPNRT